MNDTELLAALLAEKSPEDLAQLHRKVAVGKLSGLLHSLLCTEDHEKSCDYYIEEVSTKKSVDRDAWNDRTERMLEKVDADGEGIEEIINTLPLFIRTQGEKVTFLKFLQLLLPALLTHSIAARDARLARNASSSQSGPLAIAESLEE